MIKKNRYFRKDINILEAYEYKPPRFEKYRPHMMYIGPVLGVLLAVTLVYLGLFYYPLVKQQKKTAVVKEQRNEVQELLDNSIGEKQFQEYQDTKSKVDKYEMLLKIIDTYPELNLDDLSKILDTTLGAWITSFSYNNATHAITVSYEALQQEVYPQIITQLRATKLFDQIVYNGYQGSKRDITQTQMVPYVQEEQATLQGVSSVYTFPITFLSGTVQQPLTIDQEEGKDAQTQSSSQTQNDKQEVQTAPQQTTQDSQTQGQSNGQSNIEYREEEVVVGEEYVYTTTITYVLKGGNLNVQDEQQTDDDAKG